MKIKYISSILATLVASVSAMPFPEAAALAKASAHARLSEQFARREDSSSCGYTTPEEAVAPKHNIFAELTDDETKGAYDLLKTTFNLTYYTNATLFDNYLVWIEAIRPNKTDALDFLDSEGPAPARSARAVLFFGGEDFAEDEYPNGYWRSFEVGPLPVSDETTVSELTWWNAKSTVAYEFGYQDRPRSVARNAFLTREFGSEDLKPVIEDITKSPTFGAEDSNIRAWWTDPLHWDFETKTLSSWSGVFHNSDFGASVILSHGLYFKVNITGRDPDNYSIMSWYYNDIFYDSTEEFIEAYNKGDMVIAETPAFEDETWTNPSYIGGDRELDEKIAPIHVEPQGRRWKFNETERYFTWMDWEFYTSWSREQGLTLYNVKFKGERILFELGLQEAIAEYSGDDPFQMNTVYIDSTYGFGNNAWGLIAGYDCPYNAEFFDASWHSFGNNNHQNNSYCAFEVTEDFPISRHTTGSYITVEKNPVFVIRTISTIGNYDYNLSYKFSIDGTIEVSVRAAGYIQGSYYQSEEVSFPFGSHIGKTLSGSFHDHVLSFKADLDIGGTNNNIANVKFVQKEKEFPWAKGKMYNTKQREVEFIANEDDSRLQWPENGAGALIVQAADETNAWGESRGYRIIPGMSPVHRIVDHSVTLVNQANWANEHVSFTKHKDSEPHSSHPLNAHDIYDPSVDFDNFFDSENLLGEDVVAWINVGLHHFPNTQDVPITIFNAAASSFILTPVNYFDSAQITDIKQQMFYRYKDETWNFFGTELQTCQIGVEAANYDSFNYAGLTISKDTTNLPTT